MDESIETYMPEMLKQEREIIGGRDLDIRTYSPLTLAFIGDESQIRRVESEFPTLKMPMFAGRRGADVMEQGISKADGLRRLAAWFGEAEDLSGTVAFGDSMNDLEVIREAGIGVAMGNAMKEVKEAADYVTSSIEEDGIYRACLHLGLLTD